MADDKNKAVPEIDRSKQHTSMGDVILVNASEDVVINCIKKLMAVTEMCKCEKCFLDICALVLNKIPPHYVTTYKGNLLSQLPQMSPESHRETLVIAAHAIKLVSESPQH